MIATDQGKAERTRTVKLRVLLIAVVLAALAASLIFGLTPKKVEISGEVAVTHVWLELRDAIEIQDLPLESLTMIGLAPLKFETTERSRGEDRPIWVHVRAQEGRADWELSLAGEPVRLNLELPAGSGVWLSTAGKRDGVLIHAVKNAAGGVLELGPEIRLSCSSCETAKSPPMQEGSEWRSATTLQIRPTLSRVPFRTDSRQLMLQVRPRNPGVVVEPVVVSGVSFHEKDTEPAASSIKEKGQIVIRELKRDPIPIEPGVRLRLAGPDGLHITRIESTDLLHVSFTGWVNVMEISTAAGTQSLLPSQLDWIQEHHLTRLIIVTFAALVSGILAVLKTFRIRVLKEDGK